jgi:fructan beta-fructosidase
MTSRPVPIAFAAALLAALAAAACGQELPIGRFGEADWGDWTATGTAFRLGPARADELPRLEIENAGGEPVASSEREGDGPTGTLTSPEFELARRYVAFRIGGGDDEHSTCLRLIVEGTVVRTATGWRSDRLVPASFDVNEWRGRQARVELVDESAGGWGHVNVARIVQTDAPERPPIATGPLYHEALRPLFHFTARQWTVARLNPGMQQEGWVNDLNGLIVVDGEWHLFAQRWAKCWIHAVSRDLVHWTELPPAFFEEQAGSGVQSGSCVLDEKNTSGLAAGPQHPALVAFFPRWDNRSQGIAYSVDRGRTWRFHEKNPVLIHPERDPKVFWYAPGNHWVMVLYGEGRYHILTSANLLDWKDEHHPIAESFECPDLFELPVAGDPARTKWVLVQGSGQYSVGTFDGVEFKPETPRRPCDLGPNFYATQTFNLTTGSDRRRVQLAWMHGSDFPDMPFNQQLSFPCELTLHEVPGGPDGPRLFRRPVGEIELLQRAPDRWTERTLRDGETLPLEPAGEAFRLLAKVAIPDGARLIFHLRGADVVLTAKTLASGAPPAPVAERVRSVELLLDRASVETFVNDGELSSTRFFLPHEEGLSVRSEGGATKLESLTIHPLDGAWPADAK